MDNRSREFYADQAQTGSAIREMTRCEGWAHLEAWIKSQIKANKNSLLDIPLKEVPEKRGYIKGLKAVIAHVETARQMGNAAKKELREESI